MSETTATDNTPDPLVTVTYKGCDFSYFYDDSGVGGWYTASPRPRCQPFAYTKGIMVPVSDPTSNSNLWQLLTKLALEAGVVISYRVSGNDESDSDEDVSEDGVAIVKAKKKSGKVSVSKTSGKFRNFIKLF